VIRTRTRPMTLLVQFLSHMHEGSWGYDCSKCCRAEVSMRFVALLGFLLFPLITVARSQVSTEGQACLDCHSSSTPGRRYRTANDLPYHPPPFALGALRRARPMLLPHGHQPLLAIQLDGLRSRGIPQRTRRAGRKHRRGVWSPNRCYPETIDPYRDCPEAEMRSAGATMAVSRMWPVKPPPSTVKVSLSEASQSIRKPPLDSFHALNNSAPDGLTSGSQ
jgi:hypothetical protein